MKSVRCLSGLHDASSARVFNLAAIERIQKHNPDYGKAPLFESSVFNTCILLKHRLRADEHFLYTYPKSVATKIVIPFDKSDLRLGGTSLLYGQRGFLETMREAGKYGQRSLERDKEVLDLIDQLPSLDPFLVREKLESGDINVAGCYFELSLADKQRMHDFVAAEINELISLATSRGRQTEKSSDMSSTARMVSALLTTGAEEQLEPLRLTLTMERDDFRQGIFSWRGFLYYKWSSKDLMPKLSDVAREISALTVARGARSDEAKFIAVAKRKLVDKMAEIIADVGKTINVYDSFYAGLVHRGQPQVFRDFLLKAPEMFMGLGEKIGGLSHIASFWRFRFAKRSQRPVDPELTISIFTDFLASVGLPAESLSAVDH